MKVCIILIFALLFGGCSEPPPSLDNVNSRIHLATKAQVPEILYSDDPETLFKIAKQATLLSDLDRYNTTYTGWVKKMHHSVYAAELWCTTGMSEAEERSVRKALDEFNKNNENISVLAYLKDGQYHNEWTAWQEFGKSKSQQKYYKEGNRHGRWTDWYENGQKKAEGNYKDDIRDGQETFWYKNGQKESEGNYKKGKPHGIQTVWYENGEKSSESKYREGKCMSVEVWKPNGDKCPETNLSGGNGIRIVYDENGRKVKEVRFNEGRLHGLPVSLP